jgi:P-type Cu2+ transporter
MPHIAPTSDCRNFAEEKFAMCDAVPGVCVHCAQILGAHALPLGIDAKSDLDGGAARHWVCCAGCYAAYQLCQSDQQQCATSLDSGQARLAMAAAELAKFADWDRSEILAHAAPHEDGSIELTLAVDAIHCPNCAWLIERALHRFGAIGLSVDVVLRVMQLRFAPSMVRLSAIMAELAHLGYPARLIDGRNLQAPSAKRELKQLFVAGFCAMQAMMFAEPLYWADTDLPPSTALFFAWLSALLCLPVVGYSGARFFRGAINEWRARRLAMDFLISMAITLALLGSMVGLLQGNAAIYFDAIAMFVFVLLLGRMLESRLLQRAQSSLIRLTSLLPELAELESGERVAVGALKIGDRLCLRAGQTLVADGVLLSTQCALSEALLDGESIAKIRKLGDTVLAGSVLLSVHALVQVTALGEQTRLAQIARWCKTAAQQRLPNAELEAKRATRFTGAVLLAALITACVWSVIAPTRALAVTLSVLTVACPCALGLALPLTRAVAHARAQRWGVLLLKRDALERLGRVDSVLLDKTGTLTELDEATPAISASGNLEASEVLAIANALEQGQSHPFAQRMQSLTWRALDKLETVKVHATDLKILSGLGIQGQVQFSNRLGTEQWTIGAPSLFDLPDQGEIILQGPRGRAKIRFSERLREGAQEAVQELQSLGLSVQIISGDAPSRVAEVAHALGIENAYSRQSPQQKFDHVHSATIAASTKSHKTQFPLMLGDGINDAVALASAHVAVSFASGARLAYENADALLMQSDLRALPALIQLARRCGKIAMQSLRWAQIYNLLAIPIAAFGFIGPGWAALGMGLSSLLVTLNACRLFGADANMRADSRQSAAKTGNAQATELNTPVSAEIGAK